MSRQVHVDMSRGGRGAPTCAQLPGHTRVRTVDTRVLPRAVMCAVEEYVCVRVAVRCTQEGHRLVHRHACTPRSKGIEADTCVYTPGTLACVFSQLLTR